MVTTGATWTPEQLDRIDTADELEIAVRREDGSLRRRLPIWVVRVGDTVYVRTWHRRDTGWCRADDGRDGRSSLDAMAAAAPSTLRLILERRSSPA